MFDYDDIPDDVLEEMHAERRRRARIRHWCSECHGMPGGPCIFDDDAEAEHQEQAEEA